MEKLWTAFEQQIFVQFIVHTIKHRIYCSLYTYNWSVEWLIIKSEVEFNMIISQTLKQKCNIFTFGDNV